MMSCPEEELRKRSTILREEVLKVASASLVLALRRSGLAMLPSASGSSHWVSKRMSNSSHEVPLPLPHGPKIMPFQKSKRRLDVSPGKEAPGEGWLRPGSA